MGDEKGRWTEGRPRTHASNCAHYERYRDLVEKLGELKASKLQSTCCNVTHPPIKLHPDQDRPYLEIWGLDPLHLFLLGMYFKFIVLFLGLGLRLINN